MSIIAEFFSIIARQKSPGPLLREAQAEERSHPLLSLDSCLFPLDFRQERPTPFRNP